jgi:two-component system nitrate/nitrite response regulator NarL
VNDTSPITVVLVDDHRSVLQGLEWLINAERPAMSVVGTATTIDDACRICSETHPNVLVLDLDLGGDDGARAIPRLSANGHTAVLVLTGIRDPARHYAAIMEGARGIVAKEEDAKVIAKAIRKVHAGEIWLDRQGTQKVLSMLSRRPLPAPGSGLDALIAGLTAREREIIATLSANAAKPAKEVAALLGISGHTLRNHLTSIYDKLGVSSRLALYDFAHKHRLVP